MRIFPMVPGTFFVFVCFAVSAVASGVTAGALAVGAMLFFSCRLVIL